MKINEINDLLRIIDASGLEEVEISFGGGVSIKAKKNKPNACPNAHPTPLTPHQPTTITPISPPQPTTTTDAKVQAIKSPMIGTFYRSKSPGEPPFVTVGDYVKKGQVVGIIEAMKLFNEIESEIGGRVVGILVDNASPVEYDQKLMLLSTN